MQRFNRNTNKIIGLFIDRIGEELYNEINNEVLCGNVCFGVEHVS